MDEDLNILRRVVNHLFDFDLAFFACLDDRFHQRSRCGRERYLLDRQSLFVNYFKLRANLDLSAAEALIIFCKVGKPTGREVGIYLRILSFQHIHGCLDELAEVMWEDLRGQSDSDTFHTLREQERELNGKCNRFLLSSVVR